MRRRGDRSGTHLCFLFHLWRLVQDVTVFQCFSPTAYDASGMVAVVKEMVEVDSEHVEDRPSSVGILLNEMLSMLGGSGNCASSVMLHANERMFFSESRLFAP